MNKEIPKRLSILENNLQARNEACDIALLGVSHDGNPDTIIFEQLNQADVVTVELTRGVVEAGIQGMDSKILQTNSFWRKTLEASRETIERGQLVRGIEVNQTPRISWKRLILHLGISEFAASRYVIEVKKDAIFKLLPWFTNDELEILQKQNWLLKDKPEIVRMIEEDRFHFSREVSLVCKNDKIDDNEKITLMTPPHPSITKSFFQIAALFDHLGKVTHRQDLRMDKKEAIVLAYHALMVHIMSKSERAQAREIAFVANQYVRDNRRFHEGYVQGLHIGGSYHTPVLQTIFDASLPGHSVIHVHSLYDRESKKMNRTGKLHVFFRDFIPLSRRLEAVTVKGYETEVSPKMIVNNVANAVIDNLEEFTKRLMTTRKAKAKGS